MKKKILSVLSLVMAATMLLTACSGGSSGTPAASGSTPATSGNVTKPAGNVTLTLVESITSPTRTALIRELCDKFEAATPGVKVEIISPPMEGADQKISQMLMAKQKIDVLEVRDQTFAQFSNNNWIAPLDEYLTDWDGIKTLSETAKFYMTAQSKGVTYVIPYGLFQKTLYYRADWFAEAGLEAPKTWEELVDTAIKLTDPSKNRYGYSFRGAQGVSGYLDIIMYGNAGPDNIASPVAAYFLKDQQASIWGGPDSKAGIEMYKKLFENGAPKDSVAWGFAEMVQGFIGGTTAMLIQDPEVIAMCQADMAEGTWATAPLPTGTSGKALVPTGYAGWGISSYTESPELAAELVKFLSSEENNTYFNSKHSLIPIHTTAAESPTFKEGPFAAYMTMAVNPEIYSPAIAPSMYKAYGEFNKVSDQWVQKYLQGDLTSDELSKQFDDYWMKALAEEGALW